MPLYEINATAMRGSGTYYKGRAGEALGRCRLVYKAANGAWYLADADAVATMPVIGLTMEVVNAGQVVRILKQGFIGQVTWAWTVGGDVYASTTPGVLTQTAPAGVGDTVQWVGMATRPDMIFFSPRGGGEGVGCAILPGISAYAGTDECKRAYANYFYTGDYATERLCIEAACAWVLATYGGGTVRLENRTWDARVVIDENDIVLEGEGWDTIINQTTEDGHAVYVTGSRCVVRNLQCGTTAGGGNAYDGVRVDGDNCLIENVFINGSDEHGIYFTTSADDNKCQNCYVYDPDIDGILSDGFRAIISGNTVEQVGRYGYALLGTGDGSIVSNNIMNTSANDGINISATCENCVVTGNRITSWTNEPIDDDSDTSVVANNNCGGDVMNSKGCAFATVQESIDHLAGDGWVEVPDGTFAEAVTITNNNVMLRGRGNGSIINGGATGHAISISGTNGVIKDIAVQTSAGATNNYDGINISVGGNTLTRVKVLQSDRYGFYINSRTIIDQCVIQSTDDDGILLDNSGDNSIVTGGYITGPGGDGIQINVNCENCVVVANRITGYGGVGVNDLSGTSTVASNDTT